MKISTSILSSKDRVRCVMDLNRTDTSYIHVDVMDGKFVLDKQFDTYEKIHSIHLVSKKKLDIHLMVDKPFDYISRLRDLNIEFITFHLEIDKRSIHKNIHLIHDMGYKVGIAIKPDTDIMDIEPYLDDIDMILVMSVEPGKGGQAFIPETLERIKEVKKIIEKRNILISVDGGINQETIRKVKDVDIVVVGSYIVNSDDYKKTIYGLLLDCHKKHIINMRYHIFFGLASLFLFFPVFYICVSLYHDVGLLFLFRLTSYNALETKFVVFLNLSIILFLIMINSVIHLIKESR